MGKQNPPSIKLTVIPRIPLVKDGDIVAELIVAAIKTIDTGFQRGDVLAVAHKIVSKAEGRKVNLADVTPSDRAFEVAAYTQKDPRLVELILSESSEISRMRLGTLIVRHRLGFTSANAGIDRSNVSQDKDGETVLLLPSDPDNSAKELREGIKQRTGVEIGVIIVDSHGRPFRLGTVGVAIGVSGLPALWDRRGESDLFGFELVHTEVGTADEIAAAASLLMGQAAEGTPAVLIRGLSVPKNEGRAADLVRPKDMDLYL